MADSLVEGEVRRTPRLIESQMFREVLSQTLLSEGQPEESQGCREVVCSHLKGKGADKDGAEEDGVSAEDGATRCVRRGRRPTSVAMGNLLVNAGKCLQSHVSGCSEECQGRRYVRRRPL